MNASSLYISNIQDCEDDYREGKGGIMNQESASTWRNFLDKLGLWIFSYHIFYCSQNKTNKIESSIMKDAQNVSETLNIKKTGKWLPVPLLSLHKEKISYSHLALAKRQAFSFKECEGVVHTVLIGFAFLSLCSTFGSCLFTRQ